MHERIGIELAEELFRWNNTVSGDQVRSTVIAMLNASDSERKGSSTVSKAELESRKLDHHIAHDQAAYGRGGLCWHSDQPRQPKFTSSAYMFHIPFVVENKRF